MVFTTLTPTIDCSSRNKYSECIQEHDFFSVRKVSELAEK